MRDLVPLSLRFVVHDERDTFGVDAIPRRHVDSHDGVIQRVSGQRVYRHFDAHVSVRRQFRRLVRLVGEQRDGDDGNAVEGSLVRGVQPAVTHEHLYLGVCE